MLNQILAGTPKWVFAVFFLLLYYGWMQSRTREVGYGRLVMLPGVMVVLSLVGLLSSFGPRPVAFACWAAGLALALLLNRTLRAPRGVRFDPATNRFLLPGTWVPLALMMAIYFARYVVGATTALQPQAAASLPFVTVLSAVLGALSGTFLARFLHILSSGRANPLRPAQGSVPHLVPDFAEDPLA